MSPLKPYRADPVPEKRACEACNAFAAECLVPDGDAAVPMCWLCAHHVVEHQRAIGDAMSAECTCPLRQIYPAAVFAARQQTKVSGTFAEMAAKINLEKVLNKLHPHLPHIVDSSGSGVEMLPRKRGRLDMETHCRHGHEYTVENTHIRTGGRKECRACGAASARRGRSKTSDEA